MSNHRSYTSLYLSPQKEKPKRAPPKEPTIKPRTTLEHQALLVQNLMKRDIDAPIYLPAGGKIKKEVKPPVDFVRNVQGSSAGAGSGEFHVYRAGRRKELERQKDMAEEVALTKAEEAFFDKLNAKKLQDEEKTEKNRLKRAKQKMKQDIKAQQKVDEAKQAENENQDKAPANED